MIMIGVSYSLVILLTTFVKFVQGLPIYQETNYEPLANYLKSFDYDQLNSLMVSFYRFFSFLSYRLQNKTVNKI